jgi:hypothetical protein
MIACIGFADAYLSLSNSMAYKKDEDLSFFPNYYQSFKATWLMTIGEFGLFPVDKFDTFGDILFFVCSIVLLIIMLNVLIAIAGNSLATAEENKVQYAYKERVDLIAELQQNFFIRLVKANQNEDVLKNKNLLFLSFKEEPEDEIQGGDPIAKLNKKVDRLLELKNRNK